MTHTKPLIERLKELDQKLPRRSRYMESAPDEPGYLWLEREVAKANYHDLRNALPEIIALLLDAEKIVKRNQVFDDNGRPGFTPYVDPDCTQWLARLYGTKGEE